MTNAAASLPIIERFWPAADGRTRVLRNVALVTFGTLLLTVAAKTQVPLGLVHVSMGTLAVVLVGAVYGSRLGTATLLAWLAEGAAGLPVFQGTPEKGIGLAYMMGPTGGYLLGYVLAAALAGAVVERLRSPNALLIGAGIFAAHALIDACGVAWLTALFGFEKAVAVGLLPFVAGDLLKAALATAIVLALRPTALRR